MVSFPDYLQEQLDRHGWKPADLARASGIDASLIGRWRRGEVAPAIDGARRAATALGRPLLEVLVAADLLTPEEAKQRTDTPLDPSILSNEQLVGELKRRLDTVDTNALTQADVAADPDRYVAVGQSKQSATGRPRNVRAK